MEGKISVITLVSGREEALVNLLMGLQLGDEIPDELVIVFMNEKPCELPKTTFPIKSIVLQHENKIPLARARNFGVENTSFDNLIFLDVDCIPNKNLVKDYQGLREENLYCGQVRYLSKNSMCQLDFDNLDELSSPDPIRSSIDVLPYELFWSLNFSCIRKVFEKIGGFNEDFKGYGAEDTDFAFKARENKIPLKNTKVVAYHQYHDKYEPPLNHFEDIINNSLVFYKLWGRWPMEGWLSEFENMGLITWNKEITILRHPSIKEIAMAAKRN